MSLVVGQNLKQLTLQHNICPEENYDTYSLKLTLSPVIFQPKVGETLEIDYMNSDAEDFYERSEIKAEGIVVRPGDCVLCCSEEFVNIPLGFFGTVQTKGSLARLFISMHQTDCQIEPGFKGAITFELKNNSPHAVRLRRYDNVAQLFVWTCSTDNTPAYNGRYSGSKIPTVKIVRKARNGS
ncbi:dCTP deaminase [Rhizobium ruizarguesonis]|uniref:dCTP deaminase n=1 Tax=Rhizobium ruizarguesonis TaxID=2081791 RepID=UPI0010320646|nr:hypothetical protein [Rhizobium ruizarguesonis]TBA92822.1 hypothetical protein ELH54_24755 [Rhizobium ruizarguesonis]